jgi:hypothetical protein
MAISASVSSFICSESTKECPDNMCDMATPSTSFPRIFSSTKPSATQPLESTTTTGSSSVYYQLNNYCGNLICGATVQIMHQEPHIKSLPVITTGNAAGGAVNQGEALLEALTADKDRLFAVIQSSSEEVLLAALRNPNLDPKQLLTFFKRRGVGAILTAIYANKRLMESYPVKFALVAHPDTPPHIALTVLPLLYIFDLLKLCHIPGVSADIHLAAERKIVQQLPTQPLGNKLTMARRGTAAIVDALLREGVHNVVEICLDNPHLKEGSLHQFLTSSHATAENVSLVARSSRWKNRPNIRLAILKNPRTPLIWFTTFLPGLPATTRLDLLASPRLTPAQKELVRKSGSRSCV